MGVNTHINFLKRRGLLIKEDNQTNLDLDFEVIEPQPKEKPPKKQKQNVDLGPELDLGMPDVRVTDDRGIINIRGLCNRDKAKNPEKASESVYCKLVELIPDNEYDELTKSLDIVYRFLRPKLVDNKVKFHNILNFIIENDYMSLNTIHLLADYLVDVDGRDPIVMNQILNLQDADKPIESDDELRDLLNRVKTSEYSKYENSFALTDYFDKKPNSLKLEYKEIDDELNDTLVNIIHNHSSKTRKYDKNKNPNRLVYKLFSKIKQKTDLDSLVKADLVCIKDLKDKYNHIIIGEGDHVEVKKLDFFGDSYLSEFFSIYKQSDLPDFATTKDFYNMYNEIIDRLFMLIRVSPWGNKVLESISRNFSGIIYKDGDLDRFIPSTDIEIYWSNAGQPRCETQRRLSIRYRVKEGRRSSYIFNHQSDIMEHSEVTVGSHGPKILCEPMGGEKMVYPKRIQEDSVTDREGKDWESNSPQGKMIRTKGGTVPLDNDFDWVKEFIPHVPEEPEIQALIQHLGAQEVLGDDFDDEYGGWYGSHTTIKIDSGEEWVVGTRTSMGNALHEYWDNYIDDVGVDGLGIDLGDYVDVSSWWIEDFCQEETDSYFYDIDDKELVDRYGDFDILAEIEDLEREEEELEEDYQETQEEIEHYKEALGTMEIQNQDYLQYGYEEPQHTEEDFENYNNKLEELKSSLGHIERKLEEIPDSREDYLRRLRELAEEEYKDECEHCMQNPVYCLVHEKGWYSTDMEAIEAHGFDLDRDELIRYLSGDYTNYGDMSGYDGDYQIETIDNEDYILIRVD